MGNGALQAGLHSLPEGLFAFGGFQGNVYREQKGGVVYYRKIVTVRYAGWFAVQGKRRLFKILPEGESATCAGHHKTFLILLRNKR